MKSSITCIALRLASRASVVVPNPPPSVPHLPTMSYELAARCWVLGAGCWLLGVDVGIEL